MRLLLISFVFLFLSTLQAQSPEPFPIERPKLLLQFTPPGEIGEFEIQSFLRDTTVIFYGGDFELRLDESAHVHFNKANINYESRVIAKVCGEPSAFRQSDFTEWMTGARGRSTKNPIRVSGYNACLSLSEMYPPGEEGEFSFQLILPFYTFSGTGPVSMREKLVKCLQSFSLTVTDPQLSLPSDKPIPEATISAIRGLIEKPLEDMIDTDVVMTRDDPEPVRDIDTEQEGQCTASFQAEPGPALAGGLHESQPRTWSVKRGGFISLHADGHDFDQLVYTCGSAGGCRDASSTYYHLLQSEVDFSWEILSGPGQFREIGCLPADARAATGPNVIFAVPAIGMDSSITTRIRLTIRDVDPLNPKDEPLSKTISLTTTRTQAAFDELSVALTGESFSQRIPSLPAPRIESCRPGELEIETGSQLATAPAVSGPTVSANARELVTGEWVRISVDPVADRDRYVFDCRSTYGCPTQQAEQDFGDAVQYTWTLEGPGEIVGPPTGRTILYRAPEQVASPSQTVKLSVRATNLSDKAKDADGPAGSLQLRIYPARITAFRLDPGYLPSYETGRDRIELGVALKAGNKTLDHYCAMVDFEMIERSSEPGRATNHPHFREENPDDPFPDLFFPWSLPGEANPNNQGYELYGPRKTREQDDYFDLAIAKSPTVGGDSARVWIKTEDAAAWALIRVKSPSPGWQIEGESIQALPVDRNRDRIADKWAEDNLVDNYLEDIDAFPESNFPGDGLTAFEEYRGFEIMIGTTDNTRHQRTDPVTKTVFVADLNQIGLGIFEAATGIQAFSVSESGRKRLSNSSQINFCSQYGFGGVQHGIDMLCTDGDNIPGYDHNTVGHTFQKEPKMPASTDKVMIRDRGDGFAIAHELAHACGLYHHGERGYSLTTAWVRETPDSDCSNFSYALEGGPSSGDTACIMRYPSGKIVIPRQGSSYVQCGAFGSVMDRTIQDWTVIEDNATGNTLCEQKEGTGLNANGQAHGNASKGNCKSQIRIKSWPPD